MVKISPLKFYLPKNPEEFCTNPYDIIDKEEEMQLKKNPDSLIHYILPEGDGDEVYANASKALDELKASGALVLEETPAIYVYRQESPTFSHQGFILGVSLQDYDNGDIVIHEHTREKPLKDRTNHISKTNGAAGLVWNVFKAQKLLNSLMEQAKQSTPVFDFEKYGYRHLLWKESDPEIVKNIRDAFAPIKIYIADGHHRAASGAACRKMKQEAGESGEKNWQYLLTYIASDDQIRIFPYNRVVRKLPMAEVEFLDRLKTVYSVEKSQDPFNPVSKHEVALCCKGEWYKLSVKDRNFANKRDSLDVAVLQDKVLAPILGIENPRASTNLFFVGGVEDPKEMEKFVTEKGNDLFINMYPVDIRDLEEIADAGGVMPPKSTWFDPKVLSGLVIHDLTLDV